MERQLLTLLQCVIYHKSGNLIICFMVYRKCRLAKQNINVCVTLPPNFRQVWGWGQTMTIFTNLAWEDSLGLFFCHRGHPPGTKTEIKPCIAICLRLTVYWYE